MKIRSAILLSLSLLLLLASHVWGQQPMQGRKTGRNAPCLVPEDLHLTPEQIEQMTSIQRHYLEDMIALRNDLHNRRYGLRRLLSDPTVESTDIKAKQKEVFALENEIQEKILDYQLKVRDILTPQQFRLWVSRHRMPFGHGMHKGHGMGMMHQ